ncbi:hypothetical protein HDU99_004740, partial [Rhizoclosmatium hyalinum]
MICSLPRELLDKINGFLDAASMMRFCRAIPQLNDHATIVFNAGCSLKAPLNSLWPHFQYQSIPATSYVPKEYFAMLSRFNGTTVVNPWTVLEAHEIKLMCSQVSRSLSFSDCMPNDPSELLEWSKQIVYYRKRVQNLTLRCIRYPTSIMECISQAIVDLNPSILNLKGFIGHEVSEKLSMCTRLRYLTIEYDDSEAFVGSITLKEVALGLVCIPNLRELSLIGSHQLQLEVMKSLAETANGVEKISFGTLYSDRDSKKEIELKKLLADAYFEYSSGSSTDASTVLG